MTRVPDWIESFPRPKKRVPTLFCNWTICLENLKSPTRGSDGLNMSSWNVCGSKLCLILSCLAVLACSRVANQDEGRGSISIQIPSAEKLNAMNNKVGAFGTGATVDVTKICFGVNVIGPGIVSTSATSCDIERGIVVGTVTAGGTLTVDVDTGDSRVFEIYGFLRSSSTDPCPTFDKSGWGFPIGSVYFLGSSAPTKIDKADTSVNIAVTLPTTSNNLIASRGWSPSCASTGTTAGGNSGSRTSSGSLLSQSTNLRSRANVNFAPQERVQQSTHLKSRGWKVGN